MAASIPVVAYIASIMPGTAVAQSSSLTATIDLCTAYEALVPFGCVFSNVSADPIISFYRSSDQGGTFETQPMFSVSIARIPTGRGQVNVGLGRGLYAVQLMNSGPNTATFQIGMQEIVTAFASV